MFKTFIIVEEEDLALAEEFDHVISFDSYLRDYPKLSEPQTRIINLCDTTTYLSKGYYCSLLAEARNHLVIPSVKTINSLRVAKNDGIDLMLLPRLKGKDKPAIASEVLAHFGLTVAEQHSVLAKKLFQMYPAPLLKIAFSPENTQNLRVERLSYSSLNESDRRYFISQLRQFTDNVWRTGQRKKQYRWEMAILIDPNEKVPPSDKEAIAKFVKAAEKMGIDAQPLSIDQIQNINQFDALFIRETTAIDHHTYRLASAAEAQGLVVIDDAASILRCCNKVFLHDAFSYKKVPSLSTRVVTDSFDETLAQLETEFTYPMVLKMPEGSFSKGVYKVNNRVELSAKLTDLFHDTALVLVQEFLFTEFDWRVGILNGRAIYACRYHMARNHWQIYNHSGKRLVSGGWETLPTFELPKSVLDAAIKAAKIIGNGLYGVDIKEHQGKAYVLEVNDNPSIDHEVEDGYLGDELYMLIMAEFQRRLEARGKL